MSALIDWALAALAAGYSPVACHGKAPVFRDWQKGGATTDDVRAWEADRRVTNIGILTGTVIGLDIDIADAALSERAKNLALQILGNTHLVRIGRAPRQLMVYRVASTIRKRSAAGTVHKVEVLGLGQQFVAWGKHPDTLQNYAWTEADLASVPACDVPLVSEEAIGAYLAALVDVIGPPPRPAPAASPAPPRPHSTSSGQAHSTSSGQAHSTSSGQYSNGHDNSQPDTAEALEALHAIPCGRLDYGQWIKAGFALHAALGPSAAGHYEAWSATDPERYKAGEPSAKFRSFAHNDAIHAETLFWMAREHGWKPDRERQAPGVEDLGIFRAKTHSDIPDADGVFQPIDRQTPDEQPKTNALPLRFWADLDKPIPPDKLVRRLFGINTLVEIYGPTASGKTFLTLDIAAHIALGRDWFGRPVTQGAVLYVASEGGASIENRMLAFRQHHGITEDVPFAVVPVGINLGQGGKDAARVIDAAAAVRTRTGQSVLLIVIDTLARSMAGNENDAVDMGAFIMTCDAIRVATGATVLVVHHSGKDASAGSRGSTALPSAVDTLMKSEKGDEGHIATIEKQKDGVEGTRMGFTLKTLEIGTDEETGEPITSCVVIPVMGDADAPTARRREPSGNAGLVLKALRLAVAESGEDAPASVHIPPFARVVPTDRWRDYAYRMMTDANTEARKKAFKRASSQLVAAGFVGSWSEQVWITGGRNA